MTENEVAQEVWKMIDAHDGPPAFDNGRHVAANISTRTGTDLLTCETVCAGMQEDMLKAGMIKEGW